jgi:hypothetical protein
MLMVLLGAVPAAFAQAQLGDFSLSGNGTLSAGYNGTYGDTTDSGHSLTGGGTGTITGFYFNPKFLSFDIQPYYNQNRANSTSASIDDSTGVNFSSSIFSGSHFPGFFNYSRSYNNTGTFGVPGQVDLTTNGNTQGFGVGWGVNLPGLPSVMAHFQDSSTSYSIFGTNADGTAKSKIFNVRASDRRAGFTLNGGFSHTNSDGEVPLLLTSGGTLGSNNSGKDYNFSASHSLPLNGSFSAGVNRNTYSYSSTAGNGGTAAIDDYTANASLHPFKKLTFSGTATYDDNLGGTITQAILAAGAPVTQVQNLPASNSFTLDGNTTYQATDNLSFTGDVQRRQQTFENADFGANSIRAGVRYMRILFGGSLGLSSSVSENTQDKVDGYSLGLTEMLSYSRVVRGWNVSANGNYSQNQETLLIAYTTSNYGLGGSVSRRFGKLNWSGSAGTARTGFTTLGGTTSTSNSFSTSLNTRRWFAVSANYQHSGGTAVQTFTGSTAVPLPPQVVSQTLLLLYGGDSYAFSASTSAIRHLTASASLSRAFNSTAGVSALSNNHFDELVVTTQYQFRKMNFIGGYSRFLQSVSVAGTPASRLSSFYIGINRWFNFF